MKDIYDVSKPEPPPAEAREWTELWISDPFNEDYEEVHQWKEAALARDEQSLHVIEYAAYERLERELADARLEIETRAKPMVAKLRAELADALETEDAYQTVLKKERSRSAGLIQALEKICNWTDHGRQDLRTHAVAREALAKYEETK